MADASDDRQPPNTAGAVATILRIITGLTNERVLTFAVIGVAGYLTYSVIENQAEDKASTLRFIESQLEKSEQNCAGQMKEQRAYFAEQNKINQKAFVELYEKSRRFESEERGKDRQVLSEITAFLKKQTVNEEPEISASIPEPRVKAGGP